MHDHIVLNQLSITDIFAAFSVLCCMLVYLSNQIYNLSVSHSRCLQQYLITVSVQLLCLTHTLCGPGLFEGKVF